MTVQTALKILGISLSRKEKINRPLSGDHGLARPKCWHWPDEIRTNLRRRAQRAYRRVALRAHPDHGGDPALMVRVNLAYRVVMTSRTLK